MIYRLVLDLYDPTSFYLHNIISLRPASFEVVFPASTSSIRLRVGAPAGSQAPTYIDHRAHFITFRFFLQCLDSSLSGALAIAATSSSVSRNQ